jgi:DNA-binding transcriptional LysR family regulator
MRNIDPKFVRTFLMVMETKNVTKASRLLNISQAAASQQIKRLESILNQTLFDRTKQGLYPTPAAIRMLAYAREFISLNDEIYQIAGAREYEGNVRLGCPDDLVAPFLPDILRSFAVKYPNVRVTLICRTTPQLHVELNAGKVDLIITTEESTQIGSGIVLLNDRLVLFGAFGGRAYLRRPLPVSIGSTAYGLRQATVRSLEQSNISWRAVSEVNHIEAISALVSADLAVAPLLLSTVSSSFEVLGIQHGLPILPRFSVLLYAGSSNLNGEVMELKSHILNHFQSIDNNQIKSAEIS